MNILFTILNWGLGHAVRCITLINYLQEKGHNISIASDGIALDFLKKEFPEASYFELPPYDIKYKFRFMPLNIIEKAPRIIKTIVDEQKAVRNIVKEKNIDLVINDNRMACYHKDVPSIFITHQLTVPVPNQTLRKLTNFGHHYFMNKHDYCWIPDTEGNNNLAGEISRSDRKSPPKQYLGPITTIHLEQGKEDLPLLVVLSGPEPQRSYLEEKIINQASELDNEIILIRGTNTDRTFKNKLPNLKILDLVDRKELAPLLERAQKIICRSGYTSLMDFYINPKPLFLIPTPGQWEQEYLAEHWFNTLGVPFANQKDFNLVEAFNHAKEPKVEHKEAIFMEKIDELLNQINPYKTI